jgi:uncharacterized membrane protein
MGSNRKTAIIVGVIFIIATVSPIVSVVFTGAIYEPDYLTAVSANENQVLIGVLLLLTMTAAIVLIPILMFPILKKHNETLALGYVGARIFEGFFSAVNIINILSVLSLSREFVNATAPVTSYFQTSGALIISAFNWGSILLDFPFTIGALVFNYLLYKSKLVPRWLSALGLIGAALWLTNVPLRIFSLSSSSLDILALPIAAQEMIFAAWLIAKGFNSSTIASQ